MTDAARPIAVGPGDGPTIQGPVGGPITFKARGEQTGGRLMVFENTVAPGQGPPLHTHANEDEAWYILDGEFRFTIGEDTVSAPAGSFVFAPRGVQHNFQNSGTGPARILVLFTPSGMEGFFDRMAAVPAEEIEPATFGELGADVGMKVTGPPLPAPE